MGASAAGRPDAASPSNAAPPLRVVFLGPPNAGKGTQAAMLREKLGVPGITTGDLLRREAASGTALGLRVKGIMESGGLVDDATVDEVVREHLRQVDLRRGFLLDGYPRTRAQAETLAGILAAAGPLDAVLLIAVPEEELLRRALARGRSDDREEVVRARLRVYREETEPLIGYYRRLGLLREVDGNQPIEEVGRALLAALEAHPV